MSRRGRPTVRRRRRRALPRLPARFYIAMAAIVLTLAVYAILITQSRCASAATSNLACVNPWLGDACVRVPPCPPQALRRR